MRPTRFAFVAALVVVVSACGSAGESLTSEGPAVTTSAPRPEVTVQGSVPETESVAPSSSPLPLGEGDLPFGLRRCDPEFSVIRADPSFYREEPVYVGNEQPREEVRAWAEQQPGFEDMWIDRDNYGWLVVGFTSDIDQRQADLESQFPGVGVAAAELDYGSAELDQLRDEVFAKMTANGIPIQGGASAPRGQANVFVGVLDEATLEPFAEFADDPVCFDGVDPEDAVIDGPQPTEGEGWRLLTVERTGESYRTGVATNNEQHALLWDLSGVTAERPTVDFESEIVIWFGAVYGSGCEIRMDDVVFDLEQSIVHGDFVIPGNPGACNDDANSEAYLVAVKRSALPVGPFLVQLSAEDPPRGVPEERTIVDADLSQLGATAAIEQIGVDDEFIEQADSEPVVAPGGIAEPGFERVFSFDLSCPVDVVGPVNDVVWQSVDPDRGPIADQAWVEVAETSGVVFAQILIETEPARMLLTANGVTENYLPGGSDLAPTCDS